MQGGSVPHITREVFQMVSNDQLHILQIPLVSTYYFLEAMSEYNGKLSDFIGRFLEGLIVDITYIHTIMSFVQNTSPDNLLS